MFPLNANSQWRQKLRRIFPILDLWCQVVSNEAHVTNLVLNHCNTPHYIKTQHSSLPCHYIRTNINSSSTMATLTIQYRKYGRSWLLGCIELIEMLFGIWNYVLDGDPDPDKGYFWGGWLQDFPTCHRAPFPVAHDIGIFPHAINQHSHWLATEAVKCHIKFFPWKIIPLQRNLIKILWPPVKNYQVSKIHKCPRGCTVTFILRCNL